MRTSLHCSNARCLNSGPRLVDGATAKSTSIWHGSYKEARDWWYFSIHYSVSEQRSRLAAVVALESFWGAVSDFWTSFSAVPW